jgi:hypothetical protein
VTLEGCSAWDKGCYHLGLLWEPNMRILFVVLGLIAILIGALWVGQGTGYIMWPRSSFMLQQTQWASYGAGLVIIGLVMVIYARQRRT